MGYTGQYSLGARVCTEAVATCLMIFAGESVIANELLSSTKGQGMGFGWVAVGFAFAFTVSIWCFGFISSHMNPAMLLALWVLGDLGVADFFALLAAEMLGAFFGAILVWLHYVPHFKSIPEPAAAEPHELLLRSRDYMPRSGLSIASYDSRHEPKRTLQQALSDIKYYLARPQVVRDISCHTAMVEQALGRDSLRGAPHRLRRRSVQVCDTHRRLKDVSLAGYLNSLGLDHSNVLPQPGTDHNCDNFGVGAANSAAADPNGVGGTTHDGAAPYGIAHDSTAPHAAPACHNGVANVTTKPAADACRPQQLCTDDIWSLPPQLRQHQQPQQHSHIPMQKGRYVKHVEGHQQRMDALYQAAVVADQNAKLSVFATRPGIRSPFFNWLVEFFATTFLIMAALLISDQATLLYAELKPLFQPLYALFIGYLVLVLILALGGPTGIAMNPVRDAVPRFVHWILPIPNKGSSEWWYSIIPATAGFAGGLSGAGLYKALSMLNHSQKTEGFYSTI